MKKLALSSQVITGSLTYYHLNLEKRYISNHNINVSITWAEINKGKFLRRYYVILKSFQTLLLERLVHIFFVCLLLILNASYQLVVGLNTEKYGPEKTLYLDTFHAVTSNTK